MTNQTGFMEDFLLASVSAAISKTMTSPIERVNLLVKFQDEMIQQGRLSLRYRDIFDCFRRTIASEGVSSLWRGNLRNIYGYFPTQGLNFAFKPQFKKIFGCSKNDSYFLHLLGNIASGGAAGATSLVFVYPLDFTRIGQTHSRTFAQKYRNFGISCVGIAVYRGIYFGFYDSFKPLLPESCRDNFFINFGLGWIVTQAAGIISYPLDTVRGRMILTSSVKYKSSLSCMSQILKKEGLGAFFKGAGVNMSRGIAGAAVLAVYDNLQHHYTAWRFSDD